MGEPTRSLYFGERVKPHYRALVEQLARIHAAELEAGIGQGKCFNFEILHDSWCAQLVGTGLCDCNPVVNLVEL